MTSFDPFYRLGISIVFWKNWRQEIKKLSIFKKLGCSSMETRSMTSTLLTTNKELKKGYVMFVMIKFGTILCKILEN